MRTALKQCLTAADMPCEDGDVTAVMMWAFGSDRIQGNGNKLAIAWNERHPGTFILHATDPENEVARRVAALYKASR